MFIMPLMLQSLSLSFESIFSQSQQQQERKQTNKPREALAVKQNRDLDLYLAKEEKIASPVILSHALNWASGSLVL